MNKQDFSSCKEGDKLWSIQLGECEVLEKNAHMLKCHNKDDFNWYFNSGFNNEFDSFPSLFWSNPQIQIPEKPKRKVTKTIEGWVNIYPEGQGPSAKYFYNTKEQAENGVSFNTLMAVKLSGTYEVEE